VTGADAKSAAQESLGQRSQENSQTIITWRKGLGLQRTGNFPTLFFPIFRDFLWKGLREMG